jgi:hypothetical protein
MLPKSTLLIMVIISSIKALLFETRFEGYLANPSFESPYLYGGSATGWCATSWYCSGTVSIISSGLSDWGETYAADGSQFVGLTYPGSYISQNVYLSTGGYRLYFCASSDPNDYVYTKFILWIGSDSWYVEQPPLSTVMGCYVTDFTVDSDIYTFKFECGATTGSSSVFIDNFQIIGMYFRH